MFHVTRLHPASGLIRFASAQIIVTACLSAQVGLGLAPMRLDVPIRQGQRQSGVLALTNEAPVPVRVRAELLDFRVDDTASPQFAPTLASESPYSCRSWLAMNPMEFEMGAGERRLVRYSIRAPEEVRTGSFHCAVGFTGAPPPTLSPAIGMRTNVRVIAAVFPVVGEAQAEGTIESIAASTAEQAVVTIANTGQRVFRALGTIEVLDGNGRVLQSRPLPTVPILPDRKQRLPVRYEAGELKKGQRLRVRVDLGAGEIQEASVNLDALP